jgi:hypothetical protein
VNFYQTTGRNIPEDSHHTCRRENLRSHPGEFLTEFCLPVKSVICSKVLKRHKGTEYCVFSVHNLLLFVCLILRRRQVRPAESVVFELAEDKSIQKLHFLAVGIQGIDFF